MNPFLKIIVLSLTPVMFASCYTYHIPRACRSLQPPAEQRTVYIVNPELKKEYEILRSAGVFNIVSDSTAAVKLKLYPLKRFGVCGQGMIVTMITIGQLPVSFPDRYIFSFDEIKNGNAIHNEYQLNVTQRVWFWDMFVFNKHFDRKAGKALLGDYYSKK